MEEKIAEKMEEKNEIIKLRNHFTYIFEQIWKFLFVIICILFSSEDSISLGIELIKEGNIMQGLLAMGGMLGILLIIFLWQVNRWYRTTLTIQDGTITSARATLNRRVNTIAIANISNINLEQNLFERLVGTYRMKMDTNSLSTADTTDLELVLKKKDAEEVKHLILTMLKEIQGEETNEEGVLQTETLDGGMNNNVQSGMQQSVFDEFDVEHGNYDVVYSFKEIMVNGWITSSVIEILVAVGLIISAIITMAALSQDEKDLFTIVTSMAIQVLLVFSVLWDVVKKWLNNFNFRAKREKNKIYVSYGLLKKKTYVVPVDKINAVTLQYSFIGRIFKRAVVKVINIGGQNEQLEGMTLLLADKYPELECKLKVLLPEFELPEITSFTRPPRSYMKLNLLYATITAVLLFVGVILGIQVGVEFGEFGKVSLIKELAISVGFAFILFVLILYIGYLTYRASGIRYTKDNIVIARGIFARTIQTIPYDRIQYIHQEQGPLQHCFGLMSGQLSILASIMNQTQIIGVFAEEDFIELEKRLKDTY